MTFLIDTHTFLWFITGSLKLSETAKELIEKDDSDIFISIASLWEISIKTDILSWKTRLNEYLKKQ